jgi:hypothetical protein
LQEAGGRSSDEAQVSAMRDYLFLHTLHDSNKALADFRTQELDAVATVIGAPTPVIQPGSDVVTMTTAAHSAEVAT